MSGTGKRFTPAEQHLGDRLAALVDGELGHDARERVLSHLATCQSCKAEADAQRELKSVFADTSPPPPSDGLLARLQGLPAGGDPGSPGGPGGPARHGHGAPDGLADGEGEQGRRLPPARLGSGRSALSPGLLPGGRGPSALPADGFRIHREHDLDRSRPFGRRFAFAAASAFSLAALALGSTFSSGSGAAPVAAGEGNKSSAGQVRSSSSSPSTVPGERDGRRRTSSGADRSGSARTTTGPRQPATTSLRTQTRDSYGLVSEASRSYPLLSGGSAFTPSLIRVPPTPKAISEERAKAVPEKQRPVPGAGPGRGRTPTAPAVPEPTPAVSAAAPQP